MPFQYILSIKNIIHNTYMLEQFIAICVVRWLVWTIYMQICKFRHIAIYCSHICPLESQVFIGIVCFIWSV